jgi:4-carboxymuconolactone decarboxylase
MSALEPRDAALLRAALAIPDGEDGELTARFTAAVQAGVPGERLDELALMTVLFVGFPRALVAARMLRRVVPVSPGEDGGDYGRWREWTERGETTCMAVYGDHYHSLRAHVRDLHPALDAWVIVDGYGRTLGRAGMDLVRRELCAIALLIPQRVPRQLHSHLRGALNVGAPREAIEATLALAAADPLIGQAHASSARRLWQDIARKHPLALDPRPSTLDPRP